MKYYNILKLLEAKQVGILYHYTSIANALDICDQNELRPGEFDGVSFTRNKNFHTTEREEIQTGVKFVIDGDKLSENYKIQPFNYFHTPVQKQKCPSCGHMCPEYEKWCEECGTKLSFDYAKPEYIHKDYMDEQEELVKSPIRNLSKYVIKVYIDLHHADCYFEDIDDESEYPHEDIAGHDDLLKYFNRFFPTEWAK
jgi:hypothetical protein